MDGNGPEGGTPGKPHFRSKGSISAQFSQSLAGIVPGMRPLDACACASFDPCLASPHTEGTWKLLQLCRGALQSLAGHTGRHSACNGLHEHLLIGQGHAPSAGASPVTGAKGRALKDAVAKLERVATPKAYSLTRGGADRKAHHMLDFEKSHAAKRLQASFDREAGGDTNSAAFVLLSI